MNTIKDELKEDFYIIKKLFDVLEKDNSNCINDVVTMFLIDKFLDAIKVAFDYIEAAEFEARVADAMFGAIAIEIVIQNERGDIEIDKAVCLKRARLDVEAEMDKEKCL